MSQARKHRRKTSKTHVIPLVILGFFSVLAVLLVVGGIAVGIIVKGWVAECPTDIDLTYMMEERPSIVLDRDGNEIGRFQARNRTVVPYEQISPYIVDAIIDTEDRRFYQHPGVDVVGIGRAIVSNLRGRTEGASTITQQLVRNTILIDEQFEQTIKRKVKEAYLALELEDLYTKEDIVTMYLNTVYFGSGSYGIEAAAQTYFGVSAKDVTLPQAALLAGLPNAPGAYDPSEYPEASVERRNIVLNRMLTEGDITQEEYDEAVAAPLELNYNPDYEKWDDYKYPFFFEYVRSNLLDTYSEDTLYNGGLTIKTTLDPLAQSSAEHAVTDQLNEVGIDGIQGACVVLDHHTGAIIAMVGGKNHDTALAYNYAVDASRHAGSAFKLVTLVASLENKMNPQRKFDGNSPRQITDEWNVQNYGNYSYGRVTFEKATWLSLNVPYAQVAKELGADKLVETAHRLGIDSEVPANLSVALGAVNVNTLEMAEMYATIANGGIHNEPYAIEEIDGPDGTVLYKAIANPERVVDYAVASEVTRILRGVITYGTASGGYITTYQDVAGKTGTSSEVRDLWFCGYTPYCTAAFWTGYGESEQGMYWADGSEIHTYHLPIPMFDRFIDRYLEDAPIASFELSNEKIAYVESEDEKKEREAAEAEAAAKAKAEAEAAAKAAEEARKAAEEAAKAMTVPDITEEEIPDITHSEPSDTQSGSESGTTNGSVQDAAQSIEDISD